MGETNEALLHLNLQNNHIGNEGAVALGQALLKNQVLRQLKLRDNVIGEAGVEALATGAEMNMVITTLDFDSTVSVQPLLVEASSSSSKKEEASSRDGHREEGGDVGEQNDQAIDNISDNASDTLGNDDSGNSSGSPTKAPTTKFLVDHLVRINKALTSNAAALRATVCERPKPIEQGSFIVHGTDGITGQRLTYSCNYGFKVNGRDVRHCKRDKTWTGHEPSCVSERKLTAEQSAEVAAMHEL